LVQKDVVFGLQQGTAVLKEIHKEMGGLEKVELILSESDEARAYQNEINELLGGKMSNADEDEVEDELLAMEQEANAVPAMPNAPTSVQEPMPGVPADDPQRTRERQKQRAQQRRPEEAMAA